MSQALQQAVRIISASEIAVEQQAASKKACQTYQAHCRSDYRKTMQRGAEIEARKEFIENQRRALVSGNCLFVYASSVGGVKYVCVFLVSPLCPIGQAEGG